MATNKRKKRITKSGQIRDIMLTMRISKKELELVDALCAKRKLFGAKRWSRTDILIDAVKFADGQLSSLLP